MTLRIIGDVHGKFSRYFAVALPAERSIQVGDFGLGFNFIDDIKATDWLAANPNHHFIRGNHDDPAVCRNAPGFITDGKVEGDTMYLGGAWSIDQDLMTVGVDWWPDEELSYTELDAMISQYALVKPRRMITHDCPTAIAWEMFISKGRSLFGTYQVRTRTGEALQAMWELHKPEEWYFGHWHTTKRATIMGTTFQCLGELDYVEVE